MESKVYICRGVYFPKGWKLRKVTFVFRQKESYDKNAIGIWWKGLKGTGIIGKPKHQFKFFMIGISLFNLRAWIDFKYIGNKVL